MNTRELLLEMLLEITAKREYSHIMIKNVLDKYDYLEISEKVFIKRVCEGTLERMIQIDYILNQFSKVPVSKMKPVIRNILRMAVYQILFMDSIPDSAACNEAVKLAEKKKFHSLKGFVNGVLRTIVRNKENIAYPDKEKEPVFYFSVMYSMPEWLVEMWMASYGKEKTQLLLEGLLKEHDITIRLDENLPGEEQKQVLESLTEQGVEVTAHPYLPYAYTLKKVGGIQNIPEFVQGKFTVQDISSMLVAEISGVQRGDIVIDVCAAPGGKAIHIASKMKATGKVEARDLTEKKVARIQENIERLKLSNIEAQMADALQVSENDLERADIVIADLPCSGLGIIGKKRDIKYNVTKESMRDIILLQKDILSVIHAYVKPGGILLYSTCTINRKENEDMVKWFTGQYGFETESIAKYLPEQLRKETAEEGYLQLLPGVDKSDGFFMARLKKPEKIHD